MAFGLGSVLSIAAPIVGGLLQSDAAGDAADAQARTGQQQRALQKDIFDTTSERFQPFLESGTNALDAVNFNLGLGPRPENFTDFTGTPGFDFRLNQGVDAIEGSAASRGGLFSGQTGKDLETFRQGLATDEFNTNLDRLTNLAASGQNAAGNLAAAGQNFANSSSNALANIGDAQAAGSIAQGNALTGGINDALGIFQFQQQLANQRNALTGPSIGATTGNQNALSGLSGQQLLPPSF